MYWFEYKNNNGLIIKNLISRLQFFGLKTLLQFGISKSISSPYAIYQIQWSLIFKYENKVIFILSIILLIRETKLIFADLINHASNICFSILSYKFVKYEKETKNKLSRNVGKKIKKRLSQHVSSLRTGSYWLGSYVYAIFGEIIYHFISLCFSFWCC